MLALWSSFGKSFNNGAGVQDRIMTENGDISDFWTCSACYADLYQTDEQVREVIKLLELGSATLLIDIGCGNGAFAVSAASQYPSCSIVAVDCLSSAVTECQRRASAVCCKNLRAEVASADELPLADLSADRVLIRNVLHHVDSIDSTFAEISRVLRPGGMVLLETPCNTGDREFGELISDIHMLMDDSHRRSYHGVEDIMASLKKHGITGSLPMYQPYTFPVGANQVDLIRSRGEAIA